jgi:transcriptional regulator with XRE-family HTH domain
MADVRSRELGAYLRARRDRLTPADVGLAPGGGRRRVKGLRREEVAVLANVGSTWYTWLEQGRDVRPGADVLAAIADALLLSDDERRHLFLLGGQPEAAGRGPGADALGGPAGLTGSAGAVGLADPADPAGGDGRLRVLLDSLSPHPAVVLDPRFEILAYNPEFRFMVDDVEAVPEADRNWVYLHFTHPAWIDAQADYEEECEIVVGKLRACRGETLTHPAWGPLLRRLREESPRFARLWDRADVSSGSGRVKRIRSAYVGQLSLRTVTLRLHEDPHVRVVVHQPEDRTTRERLEELAGRIARGEVDGPAAVRRLRRVT